MMSKKRKWPKVVAIVVAVLVVCGLIGWNRFNHWYNTSLKPASQSAENIEFKVVSGQTPDEISQGLEDKKLIKSARAFMIYLGRTGQRSSLQAGTYLLNPGMSSQDIAEIIINGKVDTRLLTILPGLRLDEIEETLVDAGFDSEEVKEALNANYSHPLLANKPKNASLEGYIYPESIQIDSDTTVKEVINQSFEIFWSQITDDVKNGIKKQGLNLHEAITLASILGKESGNEPDQPKMARVFYNRLDQGMVLGSDVTFMYAAEIMGVEPTVDLDSPYNTRINPGLPPGPIANFNISALEAAANPAKGDWLYFVAGDDGTTYFTYTLEEHENAVEKYCKELCQL